jgi:hypothetical protein
LAYRFYQKVQRRIEAAKSLAAEESMAAAAASETTEHETKPKSAKDVPQEEIRIVVDKDRRGKVRVGCHSCHVISLNHMLRLAMPRNAVSYHVSAFQLRPYLFMACKAMLCFIKPCNFMPCVACNALR